MTEPSLKNLTIGYGKPAKHQSIEIQQLGSPHISSFNFMFESGLQKAVKDMLPLEFQMKNGDRICLSVESVAIGSPMVPSGLIGVKKRYILPTECRQRACTYKGELKIRVSLKINNGPKKFFDKELGEIPIMVKSKLCHLSAMSPNKLIESKEHEEEWGGYFIVKGHERLVRMLLMTRRNYPVALKRPTWKKRGYNFSDIGISIRCVREDETAQNNVLHYLTDGTVKLMFIYKKNMFFFPLMLLLKSLGSHCDSYIFEKLTQGYEDDRHFKDCIHGMLRKLHQDDLHTEQQCKEYIGKTFRIKFNECPEYFSNSEVTDYLLEKCILIHLKSNEDKFNLLVYMTQKLFAFSQKKCKAEGVDAVMMQELLLGGHLYLQVLKEKIQNWLKRVQSVILRRQKPVSGNDIFKEIVTAAQYSGSLESTMERFLATGNLFSATGLGLMQETGLVVIAENINRMRYMSHFRAVHRGSFFQEMRTTEARQLLPDAWGFICPVHTPDGAPCGLLNHLTDKCIVTDVVDSTLIENIPNILHKLGMRPFVSVRGDNCKDTYITLLDGKVVGFVDENVAKNFVHSLRMMKIEGKNVPSTTEIILVPRNKKMALQFPGIFLFTGPARLMRPLIHLKTGKMELVGTFEQVYLDVAVCVEEIYKGVTSHLEPSKTSFLSNLAKLIPLPDNNQSPRNMYQCQMGKQTMGTPCHNWNLQAESKLYRLQTPASPLFRPSHYDRLKMDDFPMGTNSILAVISYTGYDMEDAMIINKASIDRGFAHGSIYKAQFIEVDHVNSYFCRDPIQTRLADHMDSDGLPYIGKRVNFSDPLYCYYSYESSKYVVKSFKGKEECYVDNVRLCGSVKPKSKRLACIVFRVPRNPVVGDKFASRAGQKGIFSIRWPTEDMPFTETGLVPDVVFNPHGFPSRMTIAMMIELMAGKSAALHGLVHDATPFKFSEKNSAIEYFGKLLEIGGYNYNGTETMYSGIDGHEIKAQIFFGVVHYQRLRHMVLDKWQVRSRGPVDMKTRQPIKGRKRGGGIRFGEMERDSLISHGASFLLQDRLFHGSDKTTVMICTKCGSLLSPYTKIFQVAEIKKFSYTKEICRLCLKSDHVTIIEIPYIFKFFVAQLAAINICLKLNVKEIV